MIFRFFVETVQIWRKWCVNCHSYRYSVLILRSHSQRKSITPILTVMVVFAWTSYDLSGHPHLLYPKVSLPLSFKQHINAHKKQFSVKITEERKIKVQILCSASLCSTMVTIESNSKLSEMFQAGSTIRSNDI